MIHSIITSSGSYIPPIDVANRHFLSNRFYAEDGRILAKPNPDIVAKLQAITGIERRRHAPDDVNTSDMAFEAARRALEQTDRETLDHIIVAQNMGEITAGGRRVEMVPTIAARVKHKLGIKNPYTVAFDVPFGCPGWLHGMILADYFIRSGDAGKVLVIGAEILSRVSDPHDVDSMIYADGAGATLVEATEKRAGVLAHLTRSDTLNEANMLRMGPSYNPDLAGDGDLFIKMDGHDIYKYALKTVPRVVMQCLDKAGFHLTEVAKIFIHQANAKMDEAILKRLFKLYGVARIPPDIMPMTISELGNSSVATLPTLFDRVRRGILPGHRMTPGDVAVFASVGAGMNINAMVYQVP